MIKGNRWDTAESSKGLGADRLILLKTGHRLVQRCHRVQRSLLRGNGRDGAFIEGGRGRLVSKGLGTDKLIWLRTGLRFEHAGPKPDKHSKVLGQRL